jgi:hypothetical protein
VTYLIVGLDRHTLVPWHENVCASDVATAKLMAHARAAAQGIDVVVAAVIGPNLSVLSDAEYTSQLVQGGLQVIGRGRAAVRDSQTSRRPLHPGCPKTGR